MKGHILFPALIGFLACCIGVGCKAKPGKDAGFADAKLLAADPALPFHKSWEKPGIDRSQYKVLYIAPVNTSYMLAMTDWQKGERKKEIEQDVAKLAEFARNTMMKAFREDRKKRFHIVDEEPNTSDALIFEMALIEIVPSKVTLNAVGFAPYFIGLGVSTARAAADDLSYTAFEARLRDAGTGEIVGLYSDRESQQSALITVRGLSWYGHAEAAIRDWAQQFVAVTRRKPGERVKDSDPFTLLPW